MPDTAKPKLPQLARLLSDLPVDDGTPLHFEFEGVAKTLAELALNGENRTPFTVVVRGGWGRGKTTLLRRTQRLLEHPEEMASSVELRRVKTLWFNAWKYPTEDTVLAGLLGALLDILDKGNKKDQLAKLVASFGGSLLRNVLYLAAPAGLKAFISPEPLESRFTPVEAKRAFHDTFRDLFNQVSRLLFERGLALRDTGGLSEGALWSPEKQRAETLAIFLDDLDRCRPERVAEVLEAINLFVDLPGVCFYLGLDWERLVQVLPEAVQGAQQGRQYLEKIVQVAMDLPAVSQDGAREFVGELVTEMGLLDLIREEDLSVVAEALESRHPRHIKRFVNDLSITLAVLRNAKKLGPGADQLPEATVLVWHLLPEVLGEVEWRELKARAENVRGFLRRIEAARGEASAGKGLAEEVQRWAARGLDFSRFAGMMALSDAQLHLLVHLASPATVGSPRSSEAGSGDLLDLASGAWVALSGGTFTMGFSATAETARPPHGVSLRPFAITKYPVTNADFFKFVAETGRAAEDWWPDGTVPDGLLTHPVVNVSWADAQSFCGWLTRKLENAGQQGVASLPTEAQWEFAARGQEGREYPWGADQPDSERANFGWSTGGTTPVGAYPKGATPDRVYDLAGNVWEWCADWYGAYSSRAKSDPSGPPEGQTRVVRGGAYNLDASYLRAFVRSFNSPDSRGPGVGFRVVWLRRGNSK